MKRASMETVLDRELTALHTMSKSDNPQLVLKAVKGIKDLAQTFRLDGHETTLRPSIKRILLKYCDSVMRLPKTERD